MSVYIEYAFAENFLLDGVLLWLSLRVVKIKIAWKRLCFAAACGGVFALVCPLLTLPLWIGVFLKISVGFLLCMLAFPRLKTKNEWGRYALSSVFFFACTFFFGGALTALFPFITPLYFALGFGILSGFVLIFSKLAARRSATVKQLYDCAIAYKQRRVEILGH